MATPRRKHTFVISFDSPDVIDQHVPNYVSEDEWDSMVTYTLKVWLRSHFTDFIGDEELDSFVNSVDVRRRATSAKTDPRLGSG